MIKLKRYCCIIILLLCFSSCSSPSDNSSIQNNLSGKEISVAISAVRDVIQNKKEYFCTVYGQNIYLKDFHSSSYLIINDEGFYEYTTDKYNNTNHVYSQFCVVDMDGDGHQEVLLESETTQGNILLFHYEDGIVYGYVFPFRGMKNVKKDGSFECSGGVAVTIIGKIKFSKEKVILNELSLFDEINNIYRINRKNVTQGEVKEYLEKQDELKNAEWYVYNDANLKKYLDTD